MQTYITKVVEKEGKFIGEVYKNGRNPKKIFESEAKATHSEAGQAANAERKRINKSREVASKNRKKWEKLSFADLAVLVKESESGIPFEILQSHCAQLRDAILFEQTFKNGLSLKAAKKVANSMMGGKDEWLENALSGRLDIAREVLNQNSIDRATELVQPREMPGIPEEYEISAQAIDFVATLCAAPYFKTVVFESENVELVMDISSTGEIGTDPSHRRYAEYLLDLALSDWGGITVRQCVSPTNKMIGFGQAKQGELIAVYGFLLSKDEGILGLAKEDIAEVSPLEPEPNMRYGDATDLWLETKN